MPLGVLLDDPNTAKGVPRRCEWRPWYRSMAASAKRATSQSDSVMLSLAFRRVPHVCGRTTSHTDEIITSFTAGNTPTNFPVLTDPISLPFCGQLLPFCYCGPDIIEKATMRLGRLDQTRHNHEKSLRGVGRVGTSEITSASESSKSHWESLISQGG